MKYQERIFWMAIIVALFLFLRSCGGILGIVKIYKPKPDTISIKQIVREVQVKKDTQYIPELVGVTNTIHLPTYIHDTLETFETKILPTDTAAILSPLLPNSQLLRYPADKTLRKHYYSGQGDPK